MTTAEVPPVGPHGPSEDDPERHFYLSQLRGRSLVVAERGGSSGHDVAATVSLLAQAGAFVVHVHDGSAPTGGLGIEVATDGLTEAVIGRCWSTLRRDGAVELWLRDGQDTFVVAAAIAAALRPFKLVLADADGAPGADIDVSFRVLAAHDEGLEGVRAMALRALEDGVGSVNVCRPADIASELLTYEGAGVLYTSRQYGSVGRLGLDDFVAAEQLIANGVAAGYLKPRPDAEIARLLLSGYAARVDRHHLAGFAALLTQPYRAQRMGEVCALTTISRFSGGGVGSRLVATMLDDAATRGLHSVFACTTSAEAARFFEGLGFVAVDHDAIPADKWIGYDAARQRSVTALRHDLADRPRTAPSA